MAALVQQTLVRRESWAEKRRPSTDNGAAAAHPPSRTTSTTTTTNHTGDFSEIEALGRRLTANITTYVRHCQTENLSAPSLDPSRAGSGAVQDPKGVAAREAIVELAHKLVAMTMDPEMNLLVNSLQFHFCSSLKAAIDLGVHEKIPKNGRVSSSRLAELVGADESVLVRIMRMLTAKHVFCEPAPGMYAHTAMSWSLMKSPDTKDLLGHRLDEGFRAASRQADALAASHYREPDEHVRSAFSLAFDTPANFWEHITQKDNPAHAARGQRFNRAMRAVNINTLGVIPRLFPFHTLRGVLVDVGGGLGQLAREIMGSLSPADRTHVRCVVQDAFAAKDSAQQAQVAAANAAVGVSLQPHNFFDAQPIHGAAAYFFRHIFHDWPDRACVKILRQTARAMGPESRLLICDQVVSERPSVPSVLYDIDMWTLFGGKERTRKEWEGLLRQADERLCVRKVWTTAEAPTTILEVCLV